MERKDCDIGNFVYLLRGLDVCVSQGGIKMSIVKNEFCPYCGTILTKKDDTKNIGLAQKIYPCKKCEKGLED